MFISPTPSVSVSFGCDVDYAKDEADESLSSLSLKAAIIQNITKKKQIFGKNFMHVQTAETKCSAHRCSSPHMNA